MENRYREGLRNIGKQARDAERVLVASADAEEDWKCADAMRTVALVYQKVVGWVIAEIRDADAEDERGGEEND